MMKLTVFSIRLWDRLINCRLLPDVSISLPPGNLQFLALHSPSNDATMVRNYLPTIMYSTKSYQRTKRQLLPAILTNKFDTSTPPRPCTGYHISVPEVRNWAKKIHTFILLSLSY